jgi:uncharacterized protein (TIGR02145 family)
MSAMATAYSTDFTAMPMSLVLSGYYGAGVFNQEDSGFLWSSTAKDNTDAYYMHYDDNSILTGNNSKFYGYSVRCVF